MLVLHACSITDASSFCTQEAVEEEDELYSEEYVAKCAAAEAEQAVEQLNARYMARSVLHSAWYRKLHCANTACTTT